MTNDKPALPGAPAGCYSIKKVAPATEAAGNHETYVVSSPQGGRDRTVVTSAESAAILDKIVVAHADALKRLAKK